ncbi:hypothetical protein HH212_25460 [Massilia forsythiae]|uniref:Uncharacterized protein n=1 Tax=Massilia forsythiae TaxID=2728020 RepID=A0A7Z2W194_9BURK|nr:hypothetical protein [Massilia forsythiae]QJE02928.1 hypothetical protein HH212_25460 [Massilia forsythiae]
MTTSDTKHDPAAKGSGMLHEADIGSGERSPAQHETDQMIKEIPPLPADGKSGDGQPQQSQDDKPAQG